MPKLLQLATKCRVAVYHSHRQYISRSAGRSSVALVAYHIAQKRHDAYYRQNHDHHPQR
jgi:hypothetical protein